MEIKWDNEIFRCLTTSKDRSYVFLDRPETEFRPAYLSRYTYDVTGRRPGARSGLLSRFELCEGACPVAGRPPSRVLLLGAQERVLRYRKYGGRGHTPGPPADCYPISADGVLLLMRARYPAAITRLDLMLTL
ncbi:hypothetical protein EVAR_70755_1 [Eumeta japonica]|uniref:Uncharacterized protein n=1 Tax=Eumeta variegata TaxID=151549 RepID=A0A4C1SFE0_EUMVA|nr:hypothetical protein EVAR_70755_1 [Eumeta japonica]